MTKFCVIHYETSTKKEKDFLDNLIPKTCNFYGLPKIHKSEAIKNTYNNTKIWIHRNSKLQWIYIYTLAGSSWPQKDSAN